MFPGETIHSGASNICDDCKIKVNLEVLSSPAGFYVGTRCLCGPFSRESHYYKTRETAEKDLKNDTISWRT